jgi:polyferredoxin
MYRRLRTVRRITQLVFLAGFVLLFALATYPPKTRLPVDLFLRADPLIAVSAVVSLRKLIFPLVWYALPVVVLSLLLGRVYCGWVCPMGTTIDICERAFCIRGKRPAETPRWSRVKFYVLIAMIVTMVLPAAHRSTREWGITDTVGLSGVYLMDPIALLTRTFTWVGLPMVQWAVGMTSDTLTSWSDSDLVFEHPLLDRALYPIQGGLSTVARQPPPYFRLGLLTFAVFVGIIALGRYANRFWCRNLCPLGALLGVLGKVSPVRLAVSEKCTRCMRCVNECKVGAISEDPHKYVGPECVGCCSCLAVCPENAISLTTGHTDTGREDRVRVDRRRVLEAIGCGIAAAVLPKVDWGSRRTEATEKVLKVSSARLIRPPGALAEDEFVTACVCCGECMKVCPTNTLQPAFGEGGLEAVGTPIVVPRIGPCTQACNQCGEVCPTNAIASFSVEEKEHLYLGTALIDRSACIAWAADRQCLVCDEACSYDAISQKVTDGVERPVVNEPICVGCGICEFVCPVEPMGAIRVYSSGDRRHWTREEQREMRGDAEQERARGSPYPSV